MVLLDHNKMVPPSHRLSLSRKVTNSLNIRNSTSFQALGCKEFTFTPQEGEFFHYPRWMELMIYLFLVLGFILGYCFCSLLIYLKGRSV
jgi:hypothetical protein